MENEETKPEDKPAEGKEDKPAEETSGDKKEEASNEADSPLPIVTEARQLRDENKELVKEMKVLSKELKELKANELLGGTAGGAVKTEAKEETPKEYNDRVEKEISEGKHDD